MDNGLDIAEHRCVLAFHAAASDSRRKLAKFSREFVQARCASDSIDSTIRRLSNLAQKLDCELSWSRADEALVWADEPGRRIITIFDEDYPAPLREISAPPIVLFVHGNSAVLHDPQVAIVGSRKASHYGTEAAFQFARMLSERGFTITSGLAVGIDGSAHRGALDATGRTVAVYGCGIDRIYPARHRDLAQKMSEQGVLVSEFPLGAPPRPYHFPRRNRIISGLCYGTLVVEAAVKSGSLSTAIHALEQGREVFAIPGSIRNPLSAGCHLLIKQGATLVNEIDDLIDQLPIIAPTSSVATEAAANRKFKQSWSLTAAEQRLLDACEFERTTFDEVVHRSGLTPTEVSSILSALEVRGLVRSLPGNAYLRIDD